MEELEPILSDPKVVEAMIGVVIAVLTLVTGLLGFGVKRLKALQADAEATRKRVEVTNEQVTNDHDTNLRDDLTDVQRSVVSVRDDVAALTTTVHEGFRRMDHQFGETHDRLVAEKRERQNLDERDREEHARIWKALEKKDGG